MHYVLRNSSTIRCLRGEFCAYFFQEFKSAGRSARSHAFCSTQLSSLGNEMWWAGICGTSLVIYFFPLDTLLSSLETMRSSSSASHPPSHAQTLTRFHLLQVFNTLPQSPSLFTRAKNRLQSVASENHDLHNPLPSTSFHRTPTAMSLDLHTETNPPSWRFSKFGKERLLLGIWAKMNMVKAIWSAFHHLAW